MNADEMIAYLVKFMMTVIPTNAHLSENATDVETRYQHHAEVITKVAMDPDEPPLFKGDNGRLLTALLMTSVDRFESSFVKGPIVGDCNTKDGYCRKPTDKPRSFCFMQIMPGPFGITLKGDVYGRGTRDEPGIKGADLLEDDELCARVGLHMMRESMRATGDLGVYTGEGKGGKKSKHRIDLAKWWFTKEKEAQ